MRGCIYCLNGMAKNKNRESFQEVVPYAIKNQVSISSSFGNEGDLGLTFLDGMFSDFIQPVINLYPFSFNTSVCKLPVSALTVSLGGRHRTCPHQSSPHLGKELDLTQGQKLCRP